MNLTTLLFSFQGRINRAKYWWVVLINLAIFTASLIPAFFLIGLKISNDAPATGTPMNYVFMAIFAVVNLFMIWTSTATGIKRLHDRDQSGWWMLVFWGVSAIISLLQETAATPSDKNILGIGSLAVAVWIIVELGCLRGTQGPNRFGANPLEASPQ